MKHRLFLFPVLVVALLPAFREDRAFCQQPYPLYAPQLFALRQYSLDRQLIAALDKDNPKLAIALVQAGANPNTRYDPPQPDNTSPTAFMLACGPNADKNGPHLEGVTGDFRRIWGSREDLKLLRLMLQHGANVHARDTEQQTPLSLAVADNRIQTVKLLLQHGAKVNVQSVGSSPLMDALDLATADMVHLLLKHGANPNWQSSDGDSPLLHTVGSAELHLHEEYVVSNIRLLMAYGANPNLPDKQGETPIAYAQRLKRPDLVALMRKGAK